MNQNMLGIVVTEFSSDISEAMLTAALDEAAVLGAEIVTVSHVRGAYEIPLITEELLTNVNITSVVVLGFIEKGETLHGEVMAHTVSNALLNSSVNNGKAIGYGLIGPGASLEQANYRKESYARAAVQAAVASTGVLQKIRKR
jgi:6,7-dimethyl-8-ribityllumazine synthase